MKPVSQTLFGDKIGNCFAACIASLLELPINEVPNFCAYPADSWTEKLDEWLAARGLFSVEVRLDPEKPVLYPVPVGVFCILTGPSPRGSFLHSVIGGSVRCGEQHGFEIVHDPHPSGAGFGGVPATAITFLAALSPERIAFAELEVAA